MVQSRHDHSDTKAVFEEREARWNSEGGGFQGSVKEVDATGCLDASPSCLNIWAATSWPGCLMESGDGRSWRPRRRAASSSFWEETVCHRNSESPPRVALESTRLGATESKRCTACHEGPRLTHSSWVEPPSNASWADPWTNECHPSVIAPMRRAKFIYPSHLPRFRGKPK